MDTNNPDGEIGFLFVMFLSGIVCGAIIFVIASLISKVLI